MHKSSLYLFHICPMYVHVSKRPYRLHSALETSTSESLIDMSRAKVKELMSKGIQMRHLHLKFLWLTDSSCQRSCFKKAVSVSQYIRDFFIWIAYWHVKGKSEGAYDKRDSDATSASEVPVIDMQFRQSAGITEVCQNQVHAGATHIFRLTTTSFTCICPNIIGGRIGPKKLHEDMKCHLKTRNSMSAASCECVVVGNEPGTTWLISVDCNIIHNTTKNVEKWSSQGYLWAWCTKTSRKTTKSHQRGIVWIRGWRQWTRHDVIDSFDFKHHIPHCQEWRFMNFATHTWSLTSTLSDGDRGGARCHAVCADL